MENKPVSNIVAGAIISGLIIVYSVVLYFTGMQANQALGWVSYGILVGGVAYFVNAFGKANKNKLTFGNLFAYGFKVTAFTTVVFVIFMIIFNLVYPEFKEKIFEMTRQQLEQQGKLTEDQINTAVEMTKKIFIVGLIAGSIFLFALFGALGSLIGAAITKKAPPSPFDNPQ